MKEAVDLSRVKAHYSERDPAVLRDRLQHVRGGIAPGDPESAENARARNYLAELSWGAMLEGSGYSTVIDHRTDIIEHLRLPEKIAIAYEVKRPFSENNLGKIVSEARDQVLEAISGAHAVGPVPVSFGCIVLVLDHLLPPTLEEFWGATDTQRVEELLYRTVEAWREAHESALLEGNRDGVVGYFLWWRPIGRVLGPSGTFNPTEMHQVNTCVYPGALDWRRILVDSRRNRIHAVN